MFTDSCSGLQLQFHNPSSLNWLSVFWHSPGYSRNPDASRSKHTITTVRLVPVQYAKKWTAVVCGVACAYTLVSLEVPGRFGVTAFGDLTQCILLACCTLSVLPNICIAHKKAKFFCLRL